MRLIGGQRETEGQVEVCIDGVWGNICDYQWGHDDASVVCNQLGYAPDGKTFLYNIKFCNFSFHTF